MLPFGIFVWNNLLIGGEDSTVNVINVDNFKVLHTFTTKECGRIWSLEVDKYSKNACCKRTIDEEEPFTLAICCDKGLILAKVQKTMTHANKIVLTPTLEKLSDVDILTTSWQYSSEDEIVIT